MAFIYYTRLKNYLKTVDTLETKIKPTFFSSFISLSCLMTNAFIYSQKGSNFDYHKGVDKFTSNLILFANKTIPIYYGLLWNETHFGLFC